MKDKVNIIDDEVKNFIIISLIVIAIVLLFFWLTAIRINKPYKPVIPKGDQPAQITYEKILMGSILNMPEVIYYVYIEKSENPLYKYLLDTNENNYRYYRVDLNSFFNNEHQAAESSQAELKFADNTILLIENGKIVAFLDTPQKVKEYFNVE